MEGERPISLFALGLAMTPGSLSLCPQAELGRSALRRFGPTALWDRRKERWKAGRGRARKELLAVQ